MPGHGDDAYDVTGYELDLRYRVATNLLDGRARITAVATRDVARISLDLIGLHVSKAAVDGRLARWVQRAGKLVVTPATALREDAAFVIDVRYAGNPRPTPSAWGEVGWEELTDGVLVAAQPCGAPTWFPCNDLPSQKAPFRIGVTAASGYHVVANGRLVSGRVRGSETTWVYEQAEPMAPYLATVQIGRYEVIEEADAPVATTALVPAGFATAYRSAFARQSEMLELFVDRFGPYPFDAGYRVVITDDPLEIPLEAQGLSVFGTNHLGGLHERLIAHELAHQWFGNSLTLRSWHDIWLHEGFACYAEWIWSEAAGGPSADDLARQYHSLLATLPQDLVLSDPGPDDMFDDRVYKRGALTLHALRLELGDGLFFSCLRRWTQVHQHQSVSTPDFVDLVAAVAGRRLDDLFARWLERRGLPELTTAGR